MLIDPGILLVVLATNENELSITSHTLVDRGFLHDRFLSRCQYLVDNIYYLPPPPSPPSPSPPPVPLPAPAPAPAPLHPPGPHGGNSGPRVCGRPYTNCIALATIGNQQAI